jgi:predicted DNA-binding transcriptional regulator AlpA
MTPNIENAAGQHARPAITLPQSLEADRIVSVHQFAAYLGVSAATIRRKTRRGEIPPPVRLSERRIGWRIRDVLAAQAAMPVA